MQDLFATFYSAAFYLTQSVCALTIPVLYMWRILWYWNELSGHVNSFSLILFLLGNFYSVFCSSICLSVAFMSGRTDPGEGWNFTWRWKRVCTLSELGPYGFGEEDTIRGKFISDKRILVPALLLRHRSSY